LPSVILLPQFAQLRRFFGLTYFCRSSKTHILSELESRLA
jgi:hypothetical protein